MDIIIIKKTTYLIFTPWQQKCDHNFSITLGGQLLTQTNATKFLGVSIEEHLTWKDHISYLCKQISKSIGMLFRSRFYLSSKTKLALYHSQIAATRRGDKSPRLHCCCDKSLALSLLLRYVAQIQTSLNL